jgi:predicted PurR-regulated permease PerM
MGFAGVALATPLTATLMVLVNMLYIEYILGDERKRDEQK